MKINHLKSILEKCWFLIEQPYKQGNICSERHLQSEIFNILQQNKQFKDEYEIFIEPSIYCDKKDIEPFKIVGIIPDILITRKDKIVCVFEIKYKPYYYIEYKKDFTNFEKFNNLKGVSLPIYLKTNPKTGDWDYDRPYTIYEEIFFAFGVIANKDSEVLTKADEIWKGLKQPITSYIQLIGSVDNSNEANFYILKKS